MSFFGEVNLILLYFVFSVALDATPSFISYNSDMKSVTFILSFDLRGTTDELDCLDFVPFRVALLPKVFGGATCSTGGGASVGATECRWSLNASSSMTPDAVGGHRNHCSMGVWYSDGSGCYRQRDGTDVGQRATRGTQSLWRPDAAAAPADYIRILCRSKALSLLRISGQMFLVIFKFMKSFSILKFSHILELSECGTLKFGY